jgi:hypothetical protein
MRQWVAYGLLGIFFFNTLNVTAYIYLTGFGLMALSGKVLLILIGETMAQCAAMFFLVTRRLFSD